MNESAVASPNPVATSSRTRNGITLLALAATTGTLGDALLHTQRWGLNFAIWILLLVVTAAMFRHHRFPGINSSFLLPCAAAVVFAGCFAWRDSSTLRALDFLAVLLLLAMATFPIRGLKTASSGLIQWAAGVLLTGAEAVAGFLQVTATDVRWREVQVRGLGKTALAITRGALVALPFLIFFGILLMSADAAFERLISETLRIDLGLTISHAFFASFLTWIVTGYLRSTVEGTAIPSRGARPTFFSLGFIEATVVLSLLNVLFLTFVVVQIKYFFGGATLVQVTRDLTFSEYARRGFFELVAVATFILPLLLFLDWVVKRETWRSIVVFRTLIAVQVALLFVIMASALGRMNVYQNEYGLTELRLYTTAFMLWLSAVFFCFVVTVLRGSRERFAIGAVASGLLTLLVLHAINPDALIVRVNHTRAEEGRRPMDGSYAGSLSGDATEDLVRSVWTLQPAQRVAVARGLLSRDREIAQDDLRSWNWSRRQARVTVSENRALLIRISQSSIPARAPGRLPLRRLNR